MRALRALSLLSVVLGLVVAGTAVSAVAAEPSSSAASSTSSSTGSAHPSRRSIAPPTDDSLTTTIMSTPAPFSTDRSPTFTYQAPDRPGVRFRCALQLGDATPTEQDCVAGLTTSDGVTTATMQYAALAPSTEAYQFSVQAYAPAGDGTAEVDGPVASYDWHLYALFARDSYRPGTGASFNNQLGNRTAQERNLRHTIRAIDSMPGYQQPAAGGAPCPPTAAAAPSRIRIALYSMSDGPFANSLIAASRRCVSVQLLMNSHLTRSDDPAFRRLQDAVGTNRDGRSFAWRCSWGCRGSGVLHTKMYLFDTQEAGATGAIRATVMFGSSNMTQNAAQHQWNDLYTVAGNRGLYDDYAGYFDLMKLDDGFHRNPDRYGVAAGYPTVFWPVGANQSDPEKDVLRSLRCGGATGGTGVHGHTAVYINMHAWFGLRGLDFVRLARDLYARG
ncbi:MAG TPA: phospholipase D-like domain-containing protein, partial [Actinopolymorphaceae bacterium]|nr:phospholipase D-like domain-containing protein [Actinopolymorphaceae bacterium]